MWNFICGFVWGSFCSIFLIDLFINSFNIVWWVYLIFFIIWFICSLVLKVYLYITDYKELASNGISIVVRIAKFMIKKRNKRRLNIN